MATKSETAVSAELQAASLAKAAERAAEAHSVVPAAKEGAAPEAPKPSTVRPTKAQNVVIVEASAALGIPLEGRPDPSTNAKYAIGIKKPNGKIRTFVSN
jgi:hypothetical protein